MINVAKVQYLNPILKNKQTLKLKALTKLENVHIISMPSKIKTPDITAMFNGLLSLVNEKARQEQMERYLRLKLKYNRLLSMYNKIKRKLYTQS